MTASNLPLLLEHADARRAQTLERLEDIVDLVDHGETMPLAVCRMGWTMPSAERAAHTVGNRELAAAIRAAMYHRK